MEHFPKDALPVVEKVSLHLLVVCGDALRNRVEIRILELFDQVIEAVESAYVWPPAK